MQINAGWLWSQALEAASGGPLRYRFTLLVIPLFWQGETRLAWKRPQRWLTG